MPSVRYYNQSAPFWDFVANLEDQGFANRGGSSNDNSEQPNPWQHPWAQQGWAGFPFGGPLPHHGRRGPPATEQTQTTPSAENEESPEAGPSQSREAPQASNEEPSTQQGSCGGPRGRCGGRGRGAWGGRGRGRNGPFHPAMMGGFGALGQIFQDQLFADGDNATNTSASKDRASEDFRPEADVFDTPEAYIIHLSLPGAKKEDVGVSWDAEKSELSVAGVVYRPGVDEEMLQTLALDERRVGPFERKVRLGSRANPAQVDVEGIAARLEEGVLRVEVPKMQEEEFVAIKRVDVE